MIIGGVKLLSYKEKELIKDYLLRHNSFNLNDLCNYLIDNGSSIKSFSTGKLKIYPYVAVYIKSYTPNIEIKRLKNNVLYEVKEVLPNNTDYASENRGKMEDKPKALEQLSLF